MHYFSFTDTASQVVLQQFFKKPCFFWMWDTVLLYLLFEKAGNDPILLDNIVPALQARKSLCSNRQPECLQHQCILAEYYGWPSKRLCTDLQTARLTDFSSYRFLWLQNLGSTCSRRIDLQTRKKPKWNKNAQLWINRFSMHCRSMETRPTDFLTCSHCSNMD